MALEKLLNSVSFTAAGLWAATVSGISNPAEGDLIVTTSAAHGLESGNVVTIAGSTGVTGLNANWPILVTSATTFTLVGSDSLTGTPAGSPTVALLPLDISGFPTLGNVVNLCIESLTADKSVVIGLEDTVDNFSASVIRYTFSAKGPILPSAPVVLTASQKDFPLARFGVASAKMRLRILAIDSAATAKVSAFVAN